MRPQYEYQYELNDHELQQLTAAQQWPCISILLSARRASPTIPSGPLHLKQLLEQTAERLNKLGMRPADIQAILRSAIALTAQRHPFWQQPSSGLAIYLAPGHTAIYRTPIEFADQITIDKRFYIRPLLSLVADNGMFYLLTLSQNQVHLWRCNRYSSGEIPLPTIAHSLAEDQAYSVVEAVRTAHAIDSGGISHNRQGLAFHGQGTAADEKLVKENVRHFLQGVERVVTKRLAGQNALLVLAGAAPICAIYRDVNHYPHLYSRWLEGNVDQTAINILQTQAWNLVEHYFQKPRTEALKLYQRLCGQGSGKVLKALQPIVVAAAQQRIATLFVPLQGDYWGYLDPDQLTVTIHTTVQQSDEELLNFAVTQTLQSGGQVYSINHHDLGTEGPSGAILRY
jgi:hypothetical protein